MQFNLIIKGLLYANELTQSEEKEFEKHYERLLHFIKNRGLGLNIRLTIEETQDLRQEMAYRVINHASKKDRESVQTGLIDKIIKNLLIDHFNSRFRHGELMALDEEGEEIAIYTHASPWARGEIYKADMRLAAEQVAREIVQTLDLNTPSGRDQMSLLVVFLRCAATDPESEMKDLYEAVKLELGWPDERFNANKRIFHVRPTIKAFNKARWSENDDIKSTEAEFWAAQKLSLKITKKRNLPPIKLPKNPKNPDGTV